MRINDYRSELFHQRMMLERIKEIQKSEKVKNDLREKDEEREEKRREQTFKKCLKNQEKKLK